LFFRKKSHSEFALVPAIYWQKKRHAELFSASIEELVLKIGLA